MDLMRRQHLESQIHFAGKLSGKSMKERYLSSHMFLSPSSIENSSNSVCEAMLLGMPVVSSAVGGVTSLLTHGEEGLLYTCKDTHALAEAVIKIFADDERAKALGERARQRALRDHDPETNCRRLLEIYGEML